MSKYIVNGGKPLTGEVFIRGAKNAGYKEIIATLLSKQPSEIYNLPLISDVKLTLSIAKSLGAKFEPIGEHGIRIETKDLRCCEVPSGTGEKSRTSFIFAGPLLSRTGEITFPNPGGDKLGERPLDRLFRGLEQMGVEVKVNQSNINLKCKKLVGTTYEFNKPSHTATEVMIMAAVCAQGETVLKNSALEPEIDDMIEMLQGMGASIRRDENDLKTIRIQGKTELNGARHQVIGDRNEAVTFACAALSTKGSISILRIDPVLIEKFLTTVEAMGARVNRGEDEVLISWYQPLRAIDIETEPEPGFMTDWQAVFSLVLSQATGVSSVVERIFPYRFQHIKTLEQMGAKVKYFNPENVDFDTYYHFNKESDKPEFFHGVKIYGPTKLQPTDIKVNDLRAGATATLAALTAEGQSTIDGVEYIVRGYEKLAERLKSLGAEIKYLKT